MKKLLFGLVVTAFVLPFNANAIFISAVDVYQVGDTRTGPVTISWNHIYDGSEGSSVDVLLSIVAEGIDASPGGSSSGEIDLVYFNGTLLGSLTQQPFYNTSFDLNLGAGALGAPQTELTTSAFMIASSLLNIGINTVEVVVDPFNWIMELETSTMQVSSVPEPATFALLGAGLIGLGFSRIRKQH